MDLAFSILAVALAISTLGPVECAPSSFQRRADNDLVRNGGFEQDAHGDCPWTSITPPHWGNWIGNYIVKGCTGSTFVYNGCSNCDGMGMLKYEGDYFVQLHGDCKITANGPFNQEIDGIVDGQTYDISFTAAARPRQGNSFLFVQIDGEIVFTTNVLPDDNTWRQYSFAYTAANNEGSINLGFNHCRGGRDGVMCILTDGTDVSDNVGWSSSPFIDDVHVFGRASDSEDEVAETEAAACEGNEGKLYPIKSIDSFKELPSNVAEISEAYCVLDLVRGPCDRFDTMPSNGIEIHGPYTAVGALELVFANSATVEVEYAREDEWNKNCDVELLINGEVISSVVKGEGDSNQDRTTTRTRVNSGESLILREGADATICGVHIYSVKIMSCDEPATTTAAPAPTTLPAISPASTTPETHIFKFNETCCEEKGVPEECMGLCRERMVRSIDVYPVHRCVKHQTHIDSCVYEYVPAVDCEWNNWQVGECSVTCAGGLRTNFRAKKIEESDGTDEDGTCEGAETMVEDCNTQDCPPIHCEWNDWIYGECSDSCGTGTRTNTRTKLVVEANGGTCTGQPFGTEECTNDPCPIDCEWDEWQVGACDKDCGGGMFTKTREPKVGEQHGGEECTGHSSLTESCNVQECPVDCKWGDWSEWVDCSKTCGGGVQNATRRKLQEELYDGIPCDGEATRQQDCNPDQCPIVYEFDETCCTESGVPEECMGLCRAKTDRAVEEIFPMDRCEEHRETIRSCLKKEGAVEEKTTEVESPGPCATGYTFVAYAVANEVAACEGSFSGNIRASPLCNEGWHVCNGRDIYSHYQITAAMAQQIPGCFAYDSMNDCSGCWEHCENNAVELKPGCLDSGSGHDLTGMGSGCNINVGAKACIQDSRSNIVGGYVRSGCVVNSVPSGGGVVCCIGSSYSDEQQ